MGLGIGVALAVDVAGVLLIDTGVVATLAAYAAAIVPPPYSAAGPDLACNS